MDTIVQHVQEYWIGYTAGAICVVPLLYFTRRYSVPVIQWVVELAIYATIMHVVLHGAIRLGAWFKFESQMKMLVEEKERVAWQTPLMRFWERESYNPWWIIYCELAFIVCIFVLMIRYRPMKTQKVGAKRESLRKGLAPKKTTPELKIRGRRRR